MIRKLLLLAAALFPTAAASAQEFNPYNVAIPVNAWTGSSLWGAGVYNYASSLAAKNYAQTKIINEKGKQETLVTKKKEIEFSHYEIENKLYKADYEKRRFEEERRMQMMAATQGDITSGFSLNSLMRTMLDPANANLLESDATPLPKLIQSGTELAKRINFTDGTGRASVGLLLDEKVKWQGVLNEPVFAADRKAIETLLKEAREAVERGSDPYLAQKGLTKALGGMKFRYEEMASDDVKNHNYEYYPHLAAKEQLRQLYSTIIALSKGNLSETLAMKKYLEAATVGKLILELRDRGWQFAGASDGNEAVYRALYDQMRKAIVSGNFK